jgi:hypothetical protein
MSERRRDDPCRWFAAPLVGLALALAVFAASATSAAPASAAPTCRDLAYGSATHHDGMNELARQARLPDAQWSRQHESIVAGLCGGKPRDVDAIVAAGTVAAEQAERIAAVLGIAYTAPPASAGQQKYAGARAKLVEMGACSACADNIAQHYAHRPSSRCARLAKAALDGDAQAADQVVKFPGFCRWRYGAVRR